VRGSFDYLIVGAGFAGAVLAERLATGSEKCVLLVDRRPHIGGNAYDFHNADGVLVHAYGPHIFHTNSEEVFSYLSRFTRWRPYEHRVLAQVDGQLLPIPINRTTLNLHYGLDLSPAEAESFLKARAEPIDVIRNAADAVLSRVGSELYEKFFRFYTRKQWDVDPEALDKAVTARIPVRFDDDDRYFSDRFQMMPRDGFTLLFENMLDHPGITLALATDYRDALRDARFEKLIHTGPIDEFFEYRFGKLPYRSIELRHVTLDRERFQPVAVVNYPSPDVPYTRVTEYKHLTGQRHPKTTISYEYPCWGGEPYYPVPSPANAELYRRYRELADGLPDVAFVGRLGSYRYYNMDQVVAQALSLYARLSGRALADAARDRSRAAGFCPG
jgi:UDP-galactopyranose mutase